ncbi:hypothetical protein SPRG_21032 [Saprolegnia parasitica CBS 223.65]|uniref:CinA C-terminal domain-containing protein n=1 Tax=Saprolegnia parasitica (strain CBS 223.65) TaxID=695850 RepID=A0A067CA00_SAPPC|nr:hypothetical protein SPRG_21032 [Saprolegnia parasitica CBS 223.65]KDO23366.1 hypothetical protein SPRG_21032 [Saprolegnia parasitica CBS 223.65]|eukprot:XP_012205932.1 hypothetical protein SPRG_21032 [Saprolegnia parasitica CBS 223.65]
MAAATTVRAALQQIYASKRVQCVVSVSGGGGSAVGEILGTCGASSTLLEVLVPYHRESMADFLQVPGAELEAFGFSSKNVATLMGKKALERGRRLVPLDDAAGCIGIGCTAALVSSEPRRGSHRAFLSLHTVDAVHHFKLEMEKGARTRKEEDECVGHLVVLALAKAANVDMALQASLRELCTSHTGDSLVEDAPIATMTSGLQLPTGPHETPPRRILYELSVRNADKGSVGGDALQARVQAIVGTHHAAVVLTHASLFLEKAALFPSCAFVIGADTALRLLDLKYYDMSQEALWAALARIASLQCSFVVAGRQVGDAFVAAETVVSQVPAPFRSLFVPLPETSFRNDISSTALRQARTE